MSVSRRIAGHRHPLTWLTTVLVVLGFTHVAAAATFTVTITDDSGAGSLRDAIEQANGSAGPHTINITATGTITLASSLPPITESVEINGPGAADLTLDGDDLYRILSVTTGTVVIRDLAISHGRSEGEDGQNRQSDSSGGGGGGAAGLGGGLYITDGDVTIENVTFTDNAALGGRGGSSGFPTSFTGSGGNGGGPNGGSGGNSSNPGGSGGFASGGGGGGASTVSQHGGGEGGFGGGGGGGGGRTGGGSGGSGGDGGSFAGKGGNAQSSGGGGGGGGAGLGGAIFAYQGALTLDNVTFLRNTATRGNGGSGSSSGSAGQGKGGAVFANAGVTVIFNDLTFGTDGDANSASSHAGTPADNQHVYGFEINLPPDAPSALGPAAYADGSSGTLRTPTLQFTQSDPNTGDTLAYRIQIADNAGFNDPVVAYTSAALAQGAASFTVGQAAGTGSYEEGSEGQRLDAGSYYWRVRSHDGVEDGDWTEANNGDVAFVITYPSVDFSTDAYSGEEGAGPITVTVELGSASDSTVTVNYASSDGTAEAGVHYTAVNGTLTFNPSQTQQTFTVTPIDNDIDDDDKTVTLTLSNPDGATLGTDHNPATLTIVDDDTAGVTLTETDGQTVVTEGGNTDTYTIVLDSEPTHDVTVTATSDSQLSVGAGASNAIHLTFTAGNWNTPQTVTVTAINDSVVEGTHTGTITHKVSSDDVKYDGMAVPDVVATIFDNNFPSPQPGGPPDDDADDEDDPADDEGVVTDETGAATVTVGSSQASVNGFPPQEPVRFESEDGDRRRLTVGDPTNPIMSLTIEGLGEDTDVEVSRDESGRIQVRTTNASGQSIVVEVERPPGSPHFTIRHGANQTVTVDVATEADDGTAIVRIETALPNGDVHFFFAYDDGDASAREAAGAEVPAEAVRVGGEVSISAQGLDAGAVVTVAMRYPDILPAGVEESELRLLRLNPDTNSYALAGTTDQGVSPPTGVLGDHGVDLVEREAWTETAELGTFAVGYLVAVEPGDEPPGDDPPQDDTDEQMPDDEPEDPPAPTPCGLFGFLGLAFTAMGLTLMRRRRAAPAA